MKHGTTNVVLTKGAEGCEVFFANEHREFSVSSQLQAKFKTVDSTGGGDGFSTGLIKSLLRHWGLEKAVAYGQAVASISCSRFGTSSAFPTEEVEAALTS